jgi:hypothetical protein
VVEYFKRIQTYDALTAQTYLITNALGGRRSASISVSPNSNPNSINAGTTAGFVSRLAEHFPGAYDDG